MNELVSFTVLYFIKFLFVCLKCPIFDFEVSNSKLDQVWRVKRIHFQFLKFLKLTFEM